MLILDVNKESTYNSILYGRVGDNKGLTEKITIISSNGTPLNLNNISISFMGNTFGNRTKVIDSDGVEIIDPVNGLFQYTFPSSAFGVPGLYERAYFSLVSKEGKIYSTGDFEIVVLEDTDISADEAETVITEYNKLVAELQTLQKKNISDLQKQQDQYIQSADKNFTSIQGKITNLQNQIKTFETNVNETANEAEKSISKAAASAVQTISDALEEFEKQDFYTRSESDNRFAKKTDLTKENVQLGNVDNYATANQTEAEQGLAGNKFITPMGVKQHVDSRMADYSEISVGQSDDKMISPKGLADTIKFTEVFLPGSSLSNVAVDGTLAPHGNTAGGSLNYIKNRPYTVNSDGTFTFKRATTLLVTGGMKLIVGDTNPTDYLYINAYVNNTLNEFIALGATSATNGTLRLTWSAMGQRVISVNSGDVLSLKIGLRSGKQAFAVQLTSLKIEEV